MYECRKACHEDENNRMRLRKAKGRTGLSNALFQVYVLVFPLSLEPSTNQSTWLVLISGTQHQPKYMAGA